MKKYLIFFIILVCMFSNYKIQVFAGVCDGQEVYVSVDGGYCKTNPITFTSVTDANGKNLIAGTGKYSLVGFKAEGDVYNEKTGVAFCIDPALKSPRNPYENVRELNLSTEYDKKVYMMYQKLINDLQYSESDSNSLRAAMEAALRVWTIKNGYAYIADEVASLRQDASNFSFCAKENIDSSVDDSGHALSVNVTKDNCFGDSTTLVQNYYNVTTNIWENPIKKDDILIETIKPSATNSNYEFKFTIPGINSFFGFKKGVNVLSLDAANFKASIYIGETDCGNTACNATIINNITGGGAVNLSESSVSDLVFTISMTNEQYIQNVRAGNNKIVLKYEYNHPMNVDNAYFSRNNASVSDYQRMFGIVNYVKKDSINIKLENISLCKHISANNFVDKNGVLTNFADFLESCGCSDVKTSLLNESDMEIYNGKCVSIAVTSNLSKCTIDEELRISSNLGVDNKSEEYTIKFDETNIINSVCNVNCVETVNFTNVIGKYKNIKSGTYFQLNNYPTTIATKKCVVDVDYANWYNNFINKLDVAVEKYNIYKQAATTSVTPDGECCIGSCNCDRYGCDCCSTPTKYKWEYSYMSVERNNAITQNAGIKSASGFTCSSYDPDVSAKETDFEVAMADVTDALNKLKECNKYLLNFTTDDIYYPYEEDIKFTLEQTLYQQNSLGNYEEKRVSYTNDKILKKVISVKADPTINNYTFNNSTKLYGSLTTSGVNNQSINQFYNQPIVDYTIVRELERKHTYTTTNNYFTNSSYGKFGEHNSLNNFTNQNVMSLGKKLIDGSSIVNIGDVYDIDIKAIAKENNNYFEFTKLGDSNKIYNYFASRGKASITNKYDGSTVERNTTVDDLKRYCTYETVNDLICIPGTGDSDCDTGDEDRPSSKILFKIVDPDNIDPNNRLLEENKGFENWKGKEVVKNAIENGDTYNPDNLEYSFVLDSATIKSIRRYNETSSYSDYIGYVCDSDGNYCMSSFIDTVASGGYLNGYYFEDAFASIVNGRNEWKNYDLSSKTIVEKNVSFGNS